MFYCALGYDRGMTFIYEGGEVRPIYYKLITYRFCKIGICNVNHRLVTRKPELSSTHIPQASGRLQLYSGYWILTNQLKDTEASLACALQVVGH
jgi:hypothetical protein